MKKTILCLSLFFSLSFCATSQDISYSLLVVEKTSIAPSTRNKNITYKYEVIHYTGEDFVTLVSESSNINSIIQTLSNLKKQGWKIVSSTENFFSAPPKVSPDQMFKKGILEISTQEYLLFKE